MCTLEVILPVYNLEAFSLFIILTQHLLNTQLQLI